MIVEMITKKRFKRIFRLVFLGLRCARDQLALKGVLSTRSGDGEALLNDRDARLKALAPGKSLLKVAGPSSRTRQGKM